MKLKINVFLFFLIPVLLFSQNEIINEPENDVPTSMVLYENGSLALTGYSKSSPDEVSDQVFCVKINSDGEILWEKFYGGIYGDRPYDVLLNGQEDLIITGETWLGFGSNWGRENIFVLQIDGIGNLTQEKTYYQHHRDMPLKIKQVANGYVLIGYTKSGEDAYGDIQISKVDNDFNMIWQSTFGEIQSVDYGMDIIPLENGNEYFVLGNIGGFFNSNQVDFTTPDSDILLAKLDSQGNILWQRKYGGESHDMVEEACVIDNEIYLVGSTQTNSNGSFDLLLMKLNFDGDTLFSKTFGGAFYEMGRRIQYNDQQLFLGGVCKKENSDFASANYIVSCDFNGDVLWEKVIESSESSKLKDMVYDKSKNEIHILSTLLENNDVDFWIYSLNNNGQFSNVSPAIKHKNLTVYPNPMRDGAYIKLPLRENFVINVYDINGKLMYSEKRQANNIHEIDSQNLSSGFYTFEIILDTKERYSGKFIVY